MIKKWSFLPLPDEKQVVLLSEELKVAPIIGALLLQRGVSNFDQAKSFYRPSLTELHDPYQMKDMSKAVERLSKAIDTKEKILVYGDYDVDGATAVALVFGYLSEFTEQIGFYIPDRYAEGYGVSMNGISFAKENGYSLIISLDCGVKDAARIAAAKDSNIDFIVCDHHLPGEGIHPAYALLDPKQPGCNYPYKELSGCGVGFKLMQAFAKEQGRDEAGLFSLLDLVSVSIASDIVPITGENRILAFHGLQQINRSPRPGVKALINVADLRNDLTISNLVFGLGPRINAAGRIHHGSLAVNLLLAKTDLEAQSLAFDINKHNLTRREVDSSITDEALDMIRLDAKLLNAKSTVLFKSDWHKGVIGIVASRCIEQFYRPTVILTESNGKATGSARSVEGFDLYEAISACSDVLEQFGGHMHAAGLTLPVGNIAAFREKFEKVVSGRITEEQSVPRIKIDLNIRLDDIQPKLLRLVSQMAPFGPGNMQPVFVSENLTDNGNARILKEKHLKLFVKQGESQVLEAIGWDMAGFFDEIKAGAAFNLCYQVNENEFNGKRKIQLLIKDIQPAS